MHLQKLSIHCPQTTSDASLGPYDFSRPYFMAFPECMIAEKRCDKYSLGYAKMALPMLIRESQNSLPRQHNGANVSSYRASFRRSLLRIVLVTWSFRWSDIPLEFIHPCQVLPHKSYVILRIRQSMCQKSAPIVKCNSRDIWSVLRAEFFE